MKSEKVCFKCGICKPLREFYKHKQMADGHLNKCKECARKDVRVHRVENIDKIREYDRRRAKLDHRIKNGTENTKKFRANNPEKYKAHCLANNALRDGLIQRQPCAVCGVTERIEMHHEDYSKPLEVVFLCSMHHKRAHGKGSDY